MKLHLAQVCTHPSYVSIFGFGPAGISNTRNVEGGGQKCNYILQVSVSDKQTNCSSREREREMKLYFAGEHNVKNGRSRLTGGGWQELCVLESFYYARNNRFFPELYNNGVDLLLDSGAFTYMQGKGHVDWEKYIEDYAQFINHYKIDRFFELDIDSIIGLERTKQLRAKLERLTGRQCIPVWHISRGAKEFEQMVKEYKYAAVGGYVSREAPREKFEAAFPYLIQRAHENGCKLHGLGYTPVDIAKKPFRFDSVDSTAWIAGNRFGAVYHFNPRTGIIEKHNKPAGMRVKNLETAWNNFNEWYKFQQYLKRI